MRFATLSVLLGILPTCHHSPVDGPEDQEARLEFSVTRSLQTAAADTVRVSRISAGQMAIEGVFTTPNPCYQIAATLAEDAGSLTLRLTATHQGGFCIQVLAAFTYEAHISVLAPGTYSIVVVHTYPSTGWEERTYQLRAEVP